MELVLMYPRSVFSWDVPVVKVLNYVQLVGKSLVAAILSPRVLTLPPGPP